MEVSSSALVSSFSYSSSFLTRPQFFSFNSIPLLSSTCSSSTNIIKSNHNYNINISQLSRFTFLRTNAIALDALTTPVSQLNDDDDDDNDNKQVPHLPKVDKSGRFCSPRAARELALSILYAACLQGSDPVRLFEKRVNARREAGYEFDKAALMEYNHMSFGGPPVSADTVEEADKLMQCDIKVSEMEAEVLSAPPKLVYSKLILRFTRKLLVAVVESWDSHVLVIDKVVPQNWRILRNNFDGSESGSLLQCMNNTLTISGSRILRHWFCVSVHSRLDAVSEIAESMGSYKASQNINFDEGQSDVTIVLPKLHHVLSLGLTFLGRSPDIQPGITRIFHRTTTTSEVGEARTKVYCAKEKLDLLITSYRKQLGKGNLEFSSVSGTTHLIENKRKGRRRGSKKKVNPEVARKLGTVIRPDVF